jgi:hypothetical protein
MGATNAPTSPGGIRDKDYKAGIGVGGAHGKPGGPGRIIIEKV